MSSSDEPSEPQQLRKPACLECRRLDRLARVSAVVRDGRSVGVVRGSVPGRYGYDVPIEARVVQTSGLARALAAPVRPRPVTGLTIAVAAAGLLALWNLQLAIVAPSDAGAWLGAIAFAGIAFLCGTRLRARTREMQVTGPLVEGALWLWRRSWYCHRCGVVSVLTPNGSTLIGAHNLASSLIELSRRTRWQHQAPSQQSGAGLARQ